jgi:hypothetical protein
VNSVSWSIEKNSISLILMPGIFAIAPPIDPPNNQPKETTHHQPGNYQYECGKYGIKERLSSTDVGMAIADETE